MVDSPRRLLVPAFGVVSPRDVGLVLVQRALLLRSQHGVAVRVLGELAARELRVPLQSRGVGDACLARPPLSKITFLVFTIYATTRIRYTMAVFDIYTNPGLICLSALKASLILIAPS